MYVRSFQFTFNAKHVLTYWKSILEPDAQQNASNTQQNRLSNKKLIVSKPTEPSNTVSTTINWKSLLPSLELLHDDQLIIEQRQELIRPLFLILEKSLNQTTDFEQKTYIHQLCTTALLNLYTQLKAGRFQKADHESLLTCYSRRMQSGHIQ